LLPSAFLFGDSPLQQQDRHSKSQTEGDVTGDKPDEPAEDPRTHGHWQNARYVPLWYAILLCSQQKSKDNPQCH